MEDKDIELALRTTLGEPSLIVKKSTSSSLLPPGENFACLIYKVDATVNRSGSDKDDEELHLVAKLFPTADALKMMFDFKCLFSKEIFFYEKLVPMMKEIETQFGAKESETFDITPKLYGVKRSSLNPGSDSVDEGVLLLMDNLKQRGYYTGDKVKGLDLTHSKLAIKSLARMHALAVACKRHRPEFFKSEVLEYAKVAPFQQDNAKGDVYEALYEMMCKDSRMSEIRDRIYKLMGMEVKMKFFTYVAEEPWLSIAHHDFWTNNLLYRKNRETGELDDLKFIDFQNYSYNSPLRDLPYFLCSSTSHEVMTEHFNELLDLYYETFIEILKRAHCDVKPFSRSSFDEQLKIDASLEFFHCILAIKFFYAEIDKNNYDQSQIESVVIFSDINEKGYDKWYQIIQTYIKQGWM